MIKSFTMKTLVAAVLVTSVVGCQSLNSAPSESTKQIKNTLEKVKNDAVNNTKFAVDKAKVAHNFRKVAHAMYADSLKTAKDLQKATNRLIDNPTEANLEAAKVAYKASRSPYQQSEIMRFDTDNVTAGLDKDGGLANVDDWEGQVNAWPLDEALIDYVDTSNYEGEYAATKNIINTQGMLTVGGKSVDTSNITTDLLISLNEIGGSEANVATGVHAIEFLLWGQDVNGTKAGAGKRPVSDFNTKECTSGSAKAEAVICQRRGQYLKTAVQLLINDFTAMEAEWNSVAAVTKGTLAYDFLNTNPIEHMITSMGEMSAGELASERMRVSVLNGSTEDEHDCFSDLTHVAIQGNAQGVVNAYRGSYTKVDGTVISGPSLKDLLSKSNATLANTIDAEYSDVLERMNVISTTAENGLSFDQQIVDKKASQVIKDAADKIDDTAINLAKAGKILAKANFEFDQGTCDRSDISTCK